MWYKCILSESVFGASACYLKIDDGWKDEQLAET